MRPIYCVMVSPFGGEGELFQNRVDEGGHVAHVDFTVGVDIAHFVAVVRSAENLVDEGQSRRSR